MNSKPEIIAEKYLPKFLWWNNLPSEWKKFFIKYVDYNKKKNVSFKLLNSYIMHQGGSIFELFMVEVDFQKKIVYGEFEMLFFFERLANLKKLNLSDSGLELNPNCEYLSPLINLEILKLKDVYINNLKGIDRLSSLRSLDLRNTGAIGLYNLSNLKKLESLKYNLPSVIISEYYDDVNNCYEEEYARFDSSFLSNFKSLKRLTIKDSRAENFESLRELKNLEVLEIWNANILDSSVFSNLTKLKRLILANAGINNTDFLKSLHNLKYLDLRFNIRITDISMIRNLVNLEYLDLSNTGIVDLKPLSNLKNLRSLNLYTIRDRNHEIYSEEYVLEPDISEKEYEKLYEKIFGWNIDISPLSSLYNLKYLNLAETDVHDISPLANLKNLEKLELSYVPIRDIDPLAKISSLKSVNLQEVTGLDESKVRDFINNNKHIDINYYYEDGLPY